MSKSKNQVYIATSLDGYIADKDGDISWLESVPNPNHDDLGWSDFIGSVDAIVMGRNTFERVCSFGGPWPYPVPVYVLSQSLIEIPTEFKSNATLVKEDISTLVENLNSQKLNSLYIDGGKTIQSFMKLNLIDEIIITCFPILLGGGSSLWGDLLASQKLELVSSEVCLGQLVKTHYKVIRS